MQDTSISQPRTINFHNGVEIQQVLPSAPLLSSRPLNWPGLVLDYYNHPAHEVPEHYVQQHIISVALNECSQLHDRIEKRSVCAALKRGDLVICPAGFQRWCAWEQRAEFLVLSIDQSTLAEALYQTGDTRQLELMPHLRVRDRVIEQLAIMLMNEITTYRPGDRIYIDSLLHPLYFHLLQHYTTANPAEFSGSSHPSKRKLREAIEYMQTNMSRELDLVTIAALLHISSYELTLLFLDLTGLTPYQYFIRCRIERAKQLLSHKHLSANDIAEQIGFVTVHQFNTLFLQLAGISPAVYRAEYVL